MATRYIPPHLRNKAPDSAKENDNTTESSGSADLTRRRLADLSLESPADEGLYSLEEIGAYFGKTAENSTLHDSATKPGELAYILLFRNANPRWQRDRIIFAHTNIDILPGYKAFSSSIAEETHNVSVLSAQSGDTERPPPVEMTAAVEDLSKDLSTAKDEPAESSAQERGLKENETVTKQKSSAPQIQQTTESGGEKLMQNNISVFSEKGAFKSLRKFAFIGFFRILNVDFLKPHSPELVRMLEQKWAMTHDSSTEQAKAQAYTKRRNADRWAESLRQEWAVVKLDEVVDDGLEMPRIERRENNEMI